MAVQCTEYGSF